MQLATQPVDIIAQEESSWSTSADPNLAIKPEGIDPPEDVIRDIRRKVSRIQLNDAVRITPATFAFHITGGRWKPAKHLLYTAGRVARGIRKGNAFIIVEIPPRHGKSELLSVNTPQWLLDDSPSANVMLATYGAELATGFGRRVRDNILNLNGGADTGTETFLRCQLRKDSLNVARFHTTKGGGMASMGLGGSITGRGANVFLIDDYVKNAEEAMSPTNQKGTYNWFGSTAMTRLEPNASIIIFATRWDINDLVGQVRQSEYRDRIEYIRLPAIAEENDPLGRKEGEPLWPERYTLERLMFLKTILGKYWWSALFQQRPIRRTDIDIKPEDLKVQDPPHFSQMRYCRVWDLAATSKRGDWTVGSLLGRHTHHISALSKTYCLDIVRDRWGPTRVEAAIYETALADSPSVPIILEQEPGASGKAYAEYLKSTLLQGYEVYVYPAHTDKFLKAQPLLAAIENERFVMTPQVGTKNIQDARAEIKDFPDGTYDDIIDSWALGFNHMNEMKIRSATWGRTNSGVVAPEHAIAHLQNQVTQARSNVITLPKRNRVVFGR